MPTGIYKRKPVTDKTRKILSLSHIGIKMPPFSEQHRINLGTARRGSKHYRWSGGSNPLDKIIRKTVEYRMWRTKVYERDDYTCKHCNKRNKKGLRLELNADHIKPFSVILKEYDIKSLDDALICKELWDTNNGVTLCVNCHRKTPTFGWKIYNSLKAIHDRK